MAKADIRKFSAMTRQEFRRAAEKIRRLGVNLPRASPRMLMTIGEDIMFDIKASRPGRGVPVREGILRSSGRVIPVWPRGVELAFGSAAAPYALDQHENEEYHHNVGEARYLVRGVDRWEPNGVSAQRARAELQKEIDKLAISRKARGKLAKHIR